MGKKCAGELKSWKEELKEKTTTKNMYFIVKYILMMV
jgi:hypothetical protein